MDGFNIIDAQISTSVTSGLLVWRYQLLSSVRNSTNCILDGRKLDPNSHPDLQPEN